LSPYSVLAGITGTKYQEPISTHYSYTLRVLIIPDKAPGKIIGHNTMELLVANASVIFKVSVI
jgi:hypothetical protein